MKHPRTPGLPTLLSLLLVTTAGPALGHGGTYRGPGDNAPGGGGGGAGDTVPPGGGGGGSAAGGGSVSGPTRPVTYVPTSTPRTCGTTVSLVDTDAWQLWWGYNNADFLDVKSAIHASSLVRGSDAFFLGHAPPDHARDRLTPGEEQIRQRAVPALLAALESERDADIVTGALVALAKIGDPSGPRERPTVAHKIAPFLADGNQEIAETAAISLGILANERSIPLLIDLARDTRAGRELVGRPSGVTPRTRAFAAYGLGLAGHRVSDVERRRHIVRALVQLLDSDARELSTPDLAVACLSAIGIVELPIDDSPDRSASHLPWDSRQAQVRWLLARCSDEGLRELSRAHAPTAAARLVAGLDEPRLRADAVDVWCETIEPLARTPRLVRQSCVLALGWMGRGGDDPVDRRVRATLWKVGRADRTGGVRNFALLSLARVTSRTPDEDDSVTGQRNVRRFLLERIGSGSSVDRPWAALALGILGRELTDAGIGADPQADAGLRAGLRNARSPRDIGAFALALGMRGDLGATELLIEKLDEGDDDTRGYVCLALGMIGAPVALIPVQDIVRRSRYRPELLRQAAISLGLLGDKNLVPELIGMLREARSLSAQASLAYGLGSIGDARSIEPLCEMLANTDVVPRARAFAAVALGIVADKEPLPWNAKLGVGINYRANTMTLTDGQGAGILEIL